MRAHELMMLLASHVGKNEEIQVQVDMMQTRRIKGMEHDKQGRLVITLKTKDMP
jgi:hypothetical protein